MARLWRSVFVVAVCTHAVVIASILARAATSMRISLSRQHLTARAEPLRPLTTTDVRKLSGLYMRILPLGDSITYGALTSDGNGYRQQLQSHLSGNHVLFIGSENNGTMHNPENEGHRGATIDQISDFADRSLSKRPSVVLLMAGTNDMVFKVDPDTAPARLGKLIDKIHTQCPDAAILVAQILCSGMEDIQALTASYNAAIPGLVEQRRAQGVKIRVVPMETILHADELVDKIHPSEEGYHSIGTAWYMGLVRAHLDGLIGPPVDIAGVTPVVPGPSWSESLVHPSGLSVFFVLGLCLALFLLHRSVSLPSFVRRPSYTRLAQDVGLSRLSQRFR